jgi:hypothetical protein
MDEKLNWKRHLGYLVKRGNRRLGSLRKLCRKDGIGQNNGMSLYKAMVRPVIEYGSEIWGDSSKTNLQKLNSIEQKSLTTAMGVNRLAKSSQVNMESATTPLFLRRKRKLINTFKRIGTSKLGIYIQSSKHKRLKQKHRTSFAERAETIIRQMNFTVETVQLIKDKDLDIFLEHTWKAHIIQERKPNKQYNNGFRFRYKYQSSHMKRAKARLWHQARLDVIPTQHFLYRIKEAQSETCIFDGEVETNKHLVLKCMGYRPIWNQYFPERNNPNATVKSLLH